MEVKCGIGIKIVELFPKEMCDCISYPDCILIKQPECLSPNSYARVWETWENLTCLLWRWNSKETSAWLKLRSQDTEWSGPYDGARGGCSESKFHLLYLDKKLYKIRCIKWQITGLQPHEENHPKQTVCQKKVILQERFSWIHCRKVGNEGRNHKRLAGFPSSFLYNK